MNKVQSSNLNAVDYNTETKDMLIEFYTGQKYLYKQVPFTVYNELLHASSKGAYFNKNIRNKYVTLKVV